MPRGTAPANLIIQCRICPGPRYLLTRAYGEDAQRKLVASGVLQGLQWPWLELPCGHTYMALLPGEVYELEELKAEGSQVKG